MFITYKIGELSRLGNHRPTQPALFLHARSLPAARSAIPKLRSANPHLRIALPNCSAGRTPQKYSVQCCARKSTTRCPTAHVTNNSCCPTTPTTPAAPPLVQTHHTGTHTHTHIHTHTHTYTHTTPVFNFKNLGLRSLEALGLPAPHQKLAHWRLGRQEPAESKTQRNTLGATPKFLFHTCRKTKFTSRGGTRIPDPGSLNPLNS